MQRLLRGPLIDPAQPVLPDQPSGSPRPFAARDAWQLLGAMLLLALAWQLRGMLLLVFAALLLALLVRAAAQPLEQGLRMGPGAAVGAVLGVSLVLLTAGAWFAGQAMLDQLGALADTLPRAADAARVWLQGHAPGRWLIDWWQQSEAALPDAWRSMASVAGLTLNLTTSAVGGLLLVLAIGLYLAADPRPYRRGLIALMPHDRRRQAATTLDMIAANLRRWLLGQLVSMAVVGVFTGIGLMLLGMPLALSLALLAALLDFVPYFGPLVATVLITIVAMTEGQAMAAQALGVCLVVQTLEGYLVQPLVQRWAVRMPPAVSVVAVLAFALLFGIAGAVLAVPLAVLTMTLVRELRGAAPSTD